MDRHIAVRPEDGFEHWHAITCRDYSITECRRIPDHAFRAGVNIRAAGPLKLSEIWSIVDESERLRVDRQAGDIRRDGRDDFMLWTTLDGTTLFDQDGRTAVLGAGDMMLHDQSRPFALEFGPHSHNIMVTIPRPLLECRLPGAAALVARKIPASAPLVSSSRQLARELFEQDDSLPSAASRLLLDAAMDLWAAMFETRFAADSALLESRTAQRLHVTQLYMLEHLAEPHLSVDDIAAAQHMSSRTLLRLFASVSETPMHWLWQRRLATAYKLLAERRVARVHEAALSSGFLDMSHFSRAFRATFGRTPLDVLNG